MSMLQIGLLVLLSNSVSFAQGLPGTENGEWRYIGGDMGHTRFLRLTRSIELILSNLSRPGFGVATILARI